jgi:hypothetical protein
LRETLLAKPETAVIKIKIGISSFIKAKISII